MSIIPPKEVQCSLLNPRAHHHRLLFIMRVRWLQRLGKRDFLPLPPPYYACVLPERARGAARKRRRRGGPFPLLRLTARKKSIFFHHEKTRGRATKRESLMFNVWRKEKSIISSFVTLYQLKVLCSPLTPFSCTYE